MTGVQRSLVAGSGRSEFASSVRRCRRPIRVWRSTTSVLGLMVAVGVMFAACGGGAHRTSSTSTSSTSTSVPGVLEGAQIFQARCASCHDARLAVRVMTDFPNIDDEIAVVANGRVSSLERMPSFAGVLTTVQIREVVEYTRAQLGR